MKPGAAALLPADMLYIGPAWSAGGSRLLARPWANRYSAERYGRGSPTAI